jgi:hypothetical protein
LIGNVASNDDLFTVYQEASSIKITRPKLIPKQNYSDTIYYEEIVAKTKEFYPFWSGGEDLITIHASLLFTDIQFKEVK